jgi:hypothetical protein
MTKRINYGRKEVYSVSGCQSDLRLVYDKIITKLRRVRPKKGAMTFSITTLSIMTFSITTLSKTTLSIITFTIKIRKYNIQYNDTQHYDNLCLYQVSSEAVFLVVCDPLMNEL